MDTKKSNLIGDALGRTVYALHKSGHLFPVHLQAGAYTRPLYNLEVSNICGIRWLASVYQ
jgi:hypothetical protein